MDILYRYVGLAAGISHKLSRFSINFVPSNFLVIIACVFFIFSAPSIAAGLTWFVAFPLASVALAILALFVWLAVNKNLVFRPRRGGAAHEVRRELDAWHRPVMNPAPNVIDLHVSGTFNLGGNVRRFFLEMPASYESLGTGERRFESMIDASTSFFGMTMQSHSGAWRISLPPGTGEPFEPGTVYFGGGARPALKLTFPGPAGQNETAVLSFADGAQRTQFAKLWRE